MVYNGMEINGQTKLNQKEVFTMLLKELVLTSLDSFGDFVVNGKILDRESYLILADRTVENFYMDVNEDGQAYMSVKLEDY